MNAWAVPRILFQPTPGIAPGWNMPVTMVGGRGGEKFQPTPGIAPGWNCSSRSTRRGTERCFNPHPGSLPGGTCRADAERLPLRVTVSTHTRDRSRVEPTSAGMAFPFVRRGFNPHPGSLPGGTPRRARAGRPPRRSFNPHPGSLPGGTTRPMSTVQPQIARFQPTPGIAPGWNERAGGSLTLRARAFQPTPGIAPGWNPSARSRSAWSGTSFQPTPGIAPGWNRGSCGGRTGHRSFNPHPGSLPGGTARSHSSAEFNTGVAAQNHVGVPATHLQSLRVSRIERRPDPHDAGADHPRGRAPLQVRADNRPPPIASQDQGVVDVVLDGTAVDDEVLVQRLSEPIDPKAVR